MKCQCPDRMPCDEAFGVEALADDSLLACTLNYGVGWSGSCLWSCAAFVDTLRTGALGLREGSRDGDGQRGAREFRQEAVHRRLAELSLITLTPRARHAPGTSVLQPDRARERQNWARSS